MPGSLRAPRGFRPPGCPPGAPPVALCVAAPESGPSLICRDDESSGTLVGAALLPARAPGRADVDGTFKESRGCSNRSGVTRATAVDPVAATRRVEAPEAADPGGRCHAPRDTHAEHADKQHRCRQRPWALVLHVHRYRRQPARDIHRRVSPGVPPEGALAHLQVLFQGGTELLCSSKRRSSQQASLYAGLVSHGKPYPGEHEKQRRRPHRGARRRGQHAYQQEVSDDEIRGNREHGASKQDERALSPQPPAIRAKRIGDRGALGDGSSVRPKPWQPQQQLREI